MRRGPAVAWRPKTISRMHVSLLNSLVGKVSADVLGTHVRTAIIAGLTELFAAEVDICVDGIDAVPVGALKKLLPRTSAIALLEAVPSNARILVELDVGMAHHVVDRLLGGAGLAVSSGIMALAPT